MNEPTKRKLVANGRLTIPLYHGTSSIFIPSIATTGLGGRNLIEELGIREAARALVEVCDRLGGRDEWLLDHEGCKNIAADPSTQTRGPRLFSFRYGGVYLTPSRTTAATYATLYPFGSEAISIVKRLFDRVCACERSVEDLDVFSGLHSVTATPGFPIVVEASSVPVGDLSAEHGGDPQEYLSRIGDALDDADLFDVMTAQANFELARPLEPNLLRLYRVSRRAGAVAEFDLAEIPSSQIAGSATTRRGATCVRL